MLTEKFLKSNILELYKRYWFRRNTAFQTAWDFYFGNHRDYLPPFKNESIEELHARRKSSIVENHCKGVVNTQAVFLYGGNIGRWVKNKNTGDVDEYWQKFFSERVWPHNDMSCLMLDAEVMMGVTGFVVMTKEMELLDGKSVVNKEFSSIEKYGVVKYDFLDSSTCMPLPKITIDDDGSFKVSQRKFGALLKIYNFNEFSAHWVVNRREGNVYREHDYIEYIDDNVWFKWAKNSNGGYDVVPESTDATGVNPWGSLNIPFTLFKNPGDPMLLEGESDIADAMSLNVALNERITDDRLAMSFSSLPILLLRGATLPEEFKIKPGAGLEFPITGSAEWLTWDGKLEASIKHQELLRENIRRITSTSDLSLGGSSTGQLRSGPSLRGKFISDLLRSLLKKPFIIRSEQELMKSTMEMFAKATKKKNFSSSDYECVVEFPEDVLGLDKIVEAQIVKMESDMGAIEIEDVVRKLRPDIASDPKKMKKIIDEFEEMKKKKKQISNDIAIDENNKSNKRVDKSEGEE